MSVDKMTVYNLSVDEMAVDVMSGGEMTSLGVSCSCQPKFSKQFHVSHLNFKTSSTIDTLQLHTEREGESVRKGQKRDGEIE